MILALVLADYACDTSLTTNITSLLYVAYIISLLYSVTNISLLYVYVYKAIPRKFLVSHFIDLKNTCGVGGSLFIIDTNFRNFITNSG